MTYAFSPSLQAAVYQRLTSSTDLSALIGGAIYDAPLEAMSPPGSSDHITLGEELVLPNNTKTSHGAVHDFIVTVHSGRDGFDSVKKIAAEVCAALLDDPIQVSGGQLISMRFLRAKAERGRAPEKRKVTLLFRAVLDEDD